MFVQTLFHMQLGGMLTNQTYLFKTKSSSNLGSSNYLAQSFLGFSVYVSNTTNKLQGTLCFKDTNFNGSTIPAVFNTTCTIHGQYVIYYNERLDNVTYPADYSQYAESDLCEVEVYGKCLLIFIKHCHYLSQTLSTSSILLKFLRYFYLQ